ncbi:MAG: hypothetical protein JW803_07730 [Endomicrobiales bacterium]|nr:hypothetical protein [Endomicrobiales bacterium]
MKKILAFSFFILLVLGGLCAAEMIGRNTKQKAIKRTPACARMLDYRQQLELSSKQCSEIEKCAKEYEKKCEKLNASMHAKMAEQKKASRKGDVRLSKQKAAEIKDIIEETKNCKIDSKKKCDSYLTPRQKEKYENILKRNMEKNKKMKRSFIK